MEDKKKEIVLNAIRENQNQKTGELKVSKTEIARQLLNKHPDKFATVENARTFIRYYTKSIGKKNRSNKNDAIDVTRRIPHILIFDIETLPIHARIWGLFKPRPTIDNIIKDWCVLSWAAKWLNEDEIFGEVLTPDEAVAHDDTRILQGIWDLLDEADVVVAHNGDKFDLKKLNARFKECGLYPPSTYRSVDTLKNSYKTAKHTSHKLDYLTKKQGQQGKIHTEFGLWVDCDNGNLRALTDMFEYNKQDVTELEKYYLNNLAWMPSHPNAGVYYGGTESICPACGSLSLSLEGEKVNSVTKRFVYRCDDCGHLSYKSASGILISMPRI